LGPQAESVGDSFNPPERGCGDGRCDGDAPVLGEPCARQGGQGPELLPSVPELQCARYGVCGEGRLALSLCLLYVKRSALRQCGERGLACCSDLFRHRHTPYVAARSRLAYCQPLWVRFAQPWRRLSSSVCASVSPSHGRMPSLALASRRDWYNFRRRDLKSHRTFPTGS